MYVFTKWVYRACNSPFVTKTATSIFSVAVRGYQISRLQYTW